MNIKILNNAKVKKVVKATVITTAVTGVIGIPMITYLFIEEHKKLKELEAKLNALSTTQPPQGAEFEF